MYRIDVLTGQDAVISERLSRICAEQGLFPRIEQYPDQEHFLPPCRKLFQRTR